jgi:hypothetical protein
VTAVSIVKMNGCKQVELHRNMQVALPNVRHGVAVGEGLIGPSAGARKVRTTPPLKLPLFAISQKMAARAEAATHACDSPTQRNV